MRGNGTRRRTRTAIWCLLGASGMLACSALPAGEAKVGVRNELMRLAPPPPVEEIRAPQAVAAGFAGETATTEAVSGAIGDQASRIPVSVSSSTRGHVRPVNHFGLMLNQPQPAVAPLPGGGAEEPIPGPLEVKTLDRISLDADLPSGSAPTDFAAAAYAQYGVAEQPTGARRGWYGSAVAWESPRLWHRPLYFEDVRLERWGMTWGCLQPPVSAAKFLGNMVTLPYQMMQEACGYRTPNCRRTAR
jgi:hypothetical protein